MVIVTILLKRMYLEHLKILWQLGIDSISFLSSIHQGLVDPLDDIFVKDHCGYVVECFTRKMLNIDKVLHCDNVIKRRLKIKKILSDNGS